VARIIPKGWTRREKAKTEVTLEDLSEYLVTITEPYSYASEAYRKSRTNLLYTLVDASPRVIAITSPNSHAGKSVTCANLGVTLAQATKNVLILDCDLRKPGMHKIFGLSNIHGITDILVGTCSLEEVWQEAVEGLKVVSVGPLRPHPTELLSSRRFAELLSQVRQDFDYVLLDTPSTQVVSDPVIITSLADGVLLVVDAQNTRKASARQSALDVEAVGAVVLGVVVNKVESSLPSG
jgi:capsular exopolysaccharide synthesis family protein